MTCQARRKMRHAFNGSAVDNIALSQTGENSRVRGCLCRRSISGFGGARPLLPRQIFLGEALLSGFAFPVIIANAPAVDNDTATELTEHRASCHNGDLPRSVGVWKNVLLDKIVLFNLICDNLKQRPVFVEEQVGVTITEYSRAFGRKHEELLAATRHAKSSTFVLTVVL